MKKRIVSTLMMAVFTLVFLLSAGMLLAYDYFLLGTL